MPGVFSWAVTGLFTFGRATVDWCAGTLWKLKGTKREKLHAMYVKELIIKNYYER